MKQTERTSNDHPVYKAFASGDNDLALARNVVEYLEKRFTSIEIKIEDDYLADKIAQEVMKNNNELYKNFSDEMRVQNEKFNEDMRAQNEKFNDAIRAQGEKFNDAMLAQNEKFYSKLQMHTYWTVGTILVAAGIIIAFLQL